MVYLFLADGFEEVEALTPLDYLRRAGIDTASVGVTGASVKGAHGISVLADISMDEFAKKDDIDAIILPGGGQGTKNLSECSILREAILNLPKSKPIAAICAAPSILGGLGLLQGKNAICFPGFENSLKGATILNQAVVVDGNIITSKGAGTSQQFSFAIIENLCGKEKAEEIANQVQWI